MGHKKFLLLKKFYIQCTRHYISLLIIFNIIKVQQDCISVYFSNPVRLLYQTPSKIKSNISFKFTLYLLRMFFSLLLLCFYFSTFSIKKDIVVFSLYAFFSTHLLFVARATQFCNFVNYVIFVSRKPLLFLLYSPFFFI